MSINQHLADLSYQGFQAALAGYITALVCLGVEFAARRQLSPTAAEAASIGLRAARRGGTAVLDRQGPDRSGPDRSGPDRAGSDRLRPGDSSPQIGRIAPPTRGPREPLSTRLGRAGLVVLIVGFVAHLFSIVSRGLAAGRAPWGNMYEFSSMICAAAMVGCLVVLRRTRTRSIGFFVLIPVVTLMFVAGTVLYTRVEPLVPALKSYWLLIHVLAISLSTGVLMVSGVASAMYLLRSRYERNLVAAGPIEQSVTTAGDAGPERSAPVGHRSRLGDLPSLATLDRIAYRTAIVAFPVYTFAVIAGAMWAEAAWGRYWNWDPKETCAFISWVFYAAYLHARATAGWRGSRAAWISVLGFVSVVFNLFVVNMVISGLHSYAGLN